MAVLTDARLDTVLRIGDSDNNLPSMESGEETGCSWPKVCSIAVEVLLRLLRINREFQLFLLGYIIVSICEIFTVGGFPLNPKVRLVCTEISVRF